MIAGDNQSYRWILQIFRCMTRYILMRAIITICKISLFKIAEGWDFCEILMQCQCQDNKYGNFQGTYRTSRTCRHRLFIQTGSIKSNRCRLKSHNIITPGIHPSCVGRRLQNVLRERLGTLGRTRHSHGSNILRSSPTTYRRHFLKLIPLQAFATYRRKEWD